MKRRTGMIFLALSVMLAAIAGPASASGKAVQAAEKNAIVLAAFGTTVPGGVDQKLGVVGRSDEARLAEVLFGSGVVGQASLSPGA